MKISTVIRQFAAAFMGAFAWKYFFTVDPFMFSQEWIGLIVAAFIIALIMAIISENILLGVVVVTGVYIAYGPGIAFSIPQFLPMYGGVVAASAIWKIII